MCQETGQSISNYYSYTFAMWEKLSTVGLPLLYPEDIELFAKYQDRHQFMYFMMGLHEDF